MQVIIKFCKAEAGRNNKMTADIVECSEVDADLVMLCRTSKCGESPTVDAVENTADADCQPCRLKQIITYAVLYCAVLYYGCALYMPTLCSVWLTGTWFIGNIRRQCSTCNSEAER